MQQLKEEMAKAAADFAAQVGEITSAALAGFQLPGGIFGAPMASAPAKLASREVVAPIRTMEDLFVRKPGMAACFLTSVTVQAEHMSAPRDVLFVADPQEEKLVEQEEGPAVLQVVECLDHWGPELQEDLLRRGVGPELLAAIKELTLASFVVSL